MNTVQASLAYVVFFFSSRRRHTRLTCDWSSDVCSSDLSLAEAAEPSLAAHSRGADHDSGSQQLGGAACIQGYGYSRLLIRRTQRGTPRARSEERRVGKECRTGGGGEQ